MSSNEGSKNVFRQCIAATTEKLERLKEQKIVTDKAIISMEQSLISDRAKLKEIEDNDERP